MKKAKTWFAVVALLMLCAGVAQCGTISAQNGGELGELFPEPTWESYIPLIIVVVIMLAVAIIAARAKALHVLAVINIFLGFLMYWNALVGIDRLGATTYFILFLMVNGLTILVWMKRRSKPTPEITRSQRTTVAQPPVAMQKAPEEKYCRQCGTKNKQDAVYCENCGNKF